MNNIDLILEREAQSEKAHRDRADDTPEAKKERMVQRVAKLLRQAEGAAQAGNPEEEQAFQLRAFEIMARYGIDEALARATVDGLNKTIDPKGDHFYVTMEGRYKPLQADVYYQLVQVLHCQAVLTAGRQGRVTLHVFGMPDHLERIRIMWDLLQPQFMRGMKTAEPPFGYSHSGELRVYRRNWVRGFRDAVCERIRQAEYEAAKGAGALVLYRKDDELAERQMVAFYPNIKYTRTKARGNNSAYENGHHAGKSAVLNHQVR
jgi:hypothetical protein